MKKVYYSPLVIESEICTKTIICASNQMLPGGGDIIKEKGAPARKLYV